MTTGQRLAVFGLSVVITFGAGAGVGALVGPVGPTMPMEHSTGGLPSQVNGLRH